MSLYRMWLINRRFKKIDEWLIPAENSLTEHDYDKKIELYEEAYQKADAIFLDTLSSLWITICVYIKYVILFLFLIALSTEYYNNGFFIIISFVIVFFYRKIELNELVNRYRDMQIQFIGNKLRLLNDKIKNDKNINKEQ
ncbi:hypothetical protein [Campylobacter porcelli]|uniref:Uncharacterized protein n=1 Tax=Campylobacter porcelli TaxID=1660073 RepID=A0ABU7M4F9_9BACT|nr:hypothetical protein [Campylobacter sp. CX2-4855-23]